MFQFRAFPAYSYFVQSTLTRYCRAGFPHSEISGSMRMCRSPELIAACRVLLRLLMPRHSPCALISLTISGSQKNYAGHRRNLIARIVVCYPISTIIFSRPLGRYPLLPCFFLIIFHCSVFKVQIPGQRPDQNVQISLSVLIHSLVEIIGIEPMTSCVQSRRSPN